MRCRVAVLACALAAPLFPESISLKVMDKEVIERRLHRIEKKDELRFQALRSLYTEAGCDGDRLREQPVKGIKLANLICSTQGDGGVILIGAHFDHSYTGPGVADNWTGAVLLPSLFESLVAHPRKHGFIFVNFSGEEQGLLGSSFYVKNLGVEEKSRIRAMVNLDTLGLSPTKVWLSKSDPELANVLFGVANSLKMPLEAVSGDRVGSSDFVPFLNAGIPQITIHSVTQDTLKLLHSPFDDFKVVHIDEYYETYKLIAAYLAFLDTRLP